MGTRWNRVRACVTEFSGARWAGRPLGRIAFVLGRPAGAALAVIALATACTVPDIHVLPVPESTDKSPSTNAGDDGGGGSGGAGAGAGAAAEGGGGGSEAGADASVTMSEAGASSEAGAAGGGELRECNAGYYNCDGRPENGCEASCPCQTGCLDGAAEDAGREPDSGSEAPDAETGLPPCAVWSNATSGDAMPPAHAFEAAVETVDGENFSQYICRVRPPDNGAAYALGKVIFGHQCYVTYILNGTATQFTTASSDVIEVLTPSPSCDLVWRDAAQVRPNAALDLGRDGTPLYACRGRHNQAPSSGMQAGSILQIGGNAGCYFESWGGTNQPDTPSSYEVLIELVAR